MKKKTTLARSIRSRKGKSSSTPSEPPATSSGNGKLQMERTPGPVASPTGSRADIAPWKTPIPRLRSGVVIEHAGQVGVGPDNTTVHRGDARQSYISQSSQEQEQIATVLVLELSKVEQPQIREAMVKDLKRIEEDLARKVAEGLGLASPT